MLATPGCPLHDRNYSQHFNNQHQQHQRQYHHHQPQQHRQQQQHGNGGYATGYPPTAGGGAAPPPSAAAAASNLTEGTTAAAAKGRDGRERNEGSEGNADDDDDDDDIQYTNGQGVEQDILYKDLYVRSKPSLATDILLENTDGVGAPHWCSLGDGTPLPSVYADGRSSDRYLYVGSRNLTTSTKSFGVTTKQQLSGLGRNETPKLKQKQKLQHSRKRLVSSIWKSTV